MAEIRLTAAQQAVVDNTGGALLVSAAAGSGKTKVLVERLLARVCDDDSPANIDEFLIITYTKAAASELRGKIASELGKRLAAQPENRHLQRQMTRLYLTQISTVHAFCTSILRAYAHLLDIPADFRVAEEHEALVLRQQVLSDLLTDCYASRDERSNIIQTIDKLGYGRDDTRLSAVLLPVYDAMRCRVDPKAWLRECREAYEFGGDTRAEDTIWGKYLIGQLQKTLRAAECALQEGLSLLALDETLTEKYAPVFEENLQQVESMLKKSSWDAIFEGKIMSFGRLPPIRNCGAPVDKQKAQTLRANALDAIRAAQGCFYASSETVMRDLISTAGPIHGLLELLKEFDERYRAEKRRKKLLDFSDLEHEAIRLLVQPDTNRPTEAAREIAAMYRQVMVDEYQDSNAVQERIFEAVSQNGKNRFMVGDVKQSIYRFRLADPGIFLQKYEQYPMYTEADPDEPRKILLQENFRSRPEILQAVNDVFSLVMSREAAELDYGESERLRAGRVFPATPQTKVELHCIDLDIAVGEDEADAEKAEEEAGFVAWRIEQLLQDSTIIADGDSLRPARAGDIAILMRSPGSLAQRYQRALSRRGIASVSDRGGSILDTTEVEVLCAILSIIDNPHQDIPLITAMASQVFGFTPDELAQPRTVQRTGDYFECIRTYEQKSEKLRSFLSWLDAARAQMQWQSLIELIDAVLQQTGLQDVYAAMPDGAQRAKNIAAFRELATSFETGGAKTLAAFNEYLAGLREQGISVLPPQSDAGMDAVRIMSIHKSKGLEFPIVFLADLSRQMNLQDNTAGVLLDSELLIGANVVDTGKKYYYPSAARMAIQQRKTAQTVAEELRVLYVAMTRAKEMLIMSYCSKALVSTLKKWGGTVSEPIRAEVAASVRRMGDWVLLAALCRTEAGELFAAAGENDVSRIWPDVWKIRLHSAAALRRETAGAAAQIKPEAGKMPLRESVEQALSFRYAYPAATKVPSKLTATQLKGRLLDEEAAEQATQMQRMHKHRWMEPSFLPEKPMTAAQRGSATHLFMQFVRYEMCTSMEGIEAELDRLQRDRFLTVHQAQAVDREKILTLFTGTFGRRILAARNVRREFKFSILVDAARYVPDAGEERLMLQGVVDCFWQESGGLVIVDFKTDRVGGDAASRAAQYAPQLTAYAEALSRIYQLPVRQTYLYFFDTGEAIEL